MVDAGAPEARRDIVVLGGSAGGVEALTEIVRALPADLPAALFVVLHTPPSSVSALPEILRRSGPLTAVHAADGEPVYPRRIYVAPPDRHLLVYPGRVRLSRGPRENRNRPAIDPLFRTAAHAFGERVLGVLLSGMLDDGVAGLADVRKAGGIALAQDPREAIFPQMPQAAIDAGNVDRTATTSEIAAAILRHARNGAGRVERADPAPDVVERDLFTTIDRSSDAAPYGCPESGGALWFEGRDPLRLRCRVGHAFTEDSLAAEQSEGIERALWAASRALSERVSLAKRMVARSERNEHAVLAARYRADLEESESQLAAIERVLRVGDGVS